MKDRANSLAARLAYRIWARAGRWSLAAGVALVLVLAGGFASARIAGGSAGDAPATGAGTDAVPDTEDTPVALPALEPVEPALSGQGLLALHGDDQVTLYLEGQGVVALLVTEVVAGDEGVRVSGTVRYYLDEGGYAFAAPQFTLTGADLDPDGSELPVVTADEPVTDFSLAFPGAVTPTVLEVSAPEVATGDIDEAQMCLLSDGTTSADVLAC